MNSFFLLLWTIPAFLLYKLASSLLTKFRNARAAKRLGCKPPPRFPSPDPLGIGPIVNIIKANNKGKLVEHIVERFRLVSKQEGRPVHTMEAQFLRVPLLNTKDPKIVQAILATQFKEFELGLIRFGTFSPL
jgi:hypothetical protein